MKYSTNLKENIKNDEKENTGKIEQIENKYQDLSSTIPTITLNVNGLQIRVKDSGCQIRLKK